MVEKALPAYNISLTATGEYLGYLIAEDEADAIHRYIDGIGNTRYLRADQIQVTPKDKK